MKREKFGGLSPKAMESGTTHGNAVFGRCLADTGVKWRWRDWEFEKHKDSYIWMGTEGRGPGWKEGIRMEGKGTLTMLREGPAKGLKKGALSKAK